MSILRVAVVAVIGLGVALGQQQNGVSHARPSIGERALAIRCGDITRLDFKNLTINSGSRTFAFDNGTAANYDSPSDPERDRKPDWRAEIERDTVVQPDPKVSARFLVIHDNHETGSGWRYFISGYQCSDGARSSIAMGSHWPLIVSIRTVSMFPQLSARIPLPDKRSGNDGRTPGTAADRGT